ncbi:MAG: aminotransferase class IV, partial [Rhodospirillaceae bacterium]
AFEAVLYAPDQIVTEASASNIWMVNRGGVIQTHPATESILGGVTRETVLKLAQRAKYKIREKPFTLREMLSAKEVFLTGTTTFVMPVSRIDDKPVAGGKPGATTLDLRRRYIQHLDKLDSKTSWNV